MYVTILLNCRSRSQCSTWLPPFPASHSSTFQMMSLVSSESTETKEALNWTSSTRKEELTVDWKVNKNRLGHIPHLSSSVIIINYRCLVYKTFLMYICDHIVLYLCQRLQRHARHPASVVLARNSPAQGEDWPSLQAHMVTLPGQQEVLEAVERG